MDAGVRPQHRQPDKRVLGTEGHGSVQVIGGVFHELRRHLDAGETGYRLFRAQSPGQLDVGDVVEVELLDVAYEVGYGSRHADLFF